MSKQEMLDRLSNVRLMLGQIDFDVKEKLSQAKSVYAQELAICEWRYGQMQLEEELDIVERALEGLDEERYQQSLRDAKQRKEDAQKKKEERMNRMNIGILIAVAILCVVGIIVVLWLKK